MSSLVSPRERHLKWPGLDWLERLLYVLGGVCLAGFAIGVLCDVITREIGRPWLWLQTANMGFFVYGIFTGMALAMRRNEHMYLSEIMQSLTGRRRLLLELFSRLVVFVVALCMVVFGTLGAINDLGRLIPPLDLPFACYSVAVPIFGAMIALFALEQAINGLTRGFEDHPEPEPGAGGAA